MPGNAISTTRLVVFCAALAVVDAHAFVSKTSAVSVMLPVKSIYSVRGYHVLVRGR